MLIRSNRKESVFITAINIKHITFFEQFIEIRNRLTQTDRIMNIEVYITGLLLEVNVKHLLGAKLH